MVCFCYHGNTERDKMMKIMIYSKEAERAEVLFRLSANTVRSLSIKCELSYYTDFRIVDKYIIEDVYCYDVLILDTLSIESAKIAERVRAKNLTSAIIFVLCNSSASFPILRYRPSALLADFDHAAQLSDALDYINKEYLRLNPYLVVKNKDMTMRIHYADIIYLESKQRVITLYGKKQKISFYAKLTDIQSLLPPDKFIRCHQSYLINVDMVKKLDKKNRQFHMATDEIIEISKSYYPQVQTYF